MLAIKLKRIGKKHQPSYRLVVTEKKSKLRGRYVEDLGFYNPFSKDSRVDKDRVLYWIEHGARPTDMVNNLLVSNKIIEGSKKAVHSTKKKNQAEVQQKTSFDSAQGLREKKEEAVSEPKIKEENKIEQTELAEPEITSEKEIEEKKEE